MAKTNARPRARDAAQAKGAPRKAMAAAGATKRVRSPAVSPAEPAHVDGVEPVRAPQQDRGHRRVEQILDAAEAVFAEVGVDAATTNAIAERASASMGSLYHFFRDKDAIVLAVGHRFAERIRERNAHAMSLESLDAPLPELFDRIIGTHASFVNDTPSFALVEAVIHRRFGGCSVQEELDEAIIDQVRHFLELRLPRMSAERRMAATRLSVVAVGVTCERSGALPPAARAQLLRELRDMLVRYFEPLDREFGRGA